MLTQVPRPIPAVSYATDKFFDEVGLWYDAICPILARHTYPNGRLVAAQVDNEMAYFFHVNAYAADFHSCSVARYRAFLAEKYVDINVLNSTYGRSHGSFDDIEPPRRFEATSEGHPLLHRLGGVPGTLPGGLDEQTCWVRCAPVGSTG